MNPEVKQEDTATVKKESTTPQGTERTKARKVYVPAVDILETDTSLLLIAEMPGVDEHGVDITIEKNILTIKGAVFDPVPEGYQLAYGEYGVGDYERSFTLTNEIDRDNVQATIKHGLLKLTLPKVKQHATRKVAVTVG
ncbi:MAG: Hsp20/alpha crystallin family protein [Planctomycetes bacterium]|nr:Hsp20/alpha crystallin family protein [Planctomycetota bacterium]